MAKQSDQKTCEIYIAPEERDLLARIACRRGVGRDYLALRGLSASHSSTYVDGRPIPRWLGKRNSARPSPPAAPKARAPAQARHCRSCLHLVLLPLSDAVERYTCGRSVWTQPLQQQSVQTSQQLRLLSLTCLYYAQAAQPQTPAPHHCRACQHLSPADTVDERYVCSRRIWANPMKPQSVANARRLARISAACVHFAPRPDHWLPRSKKSRLRDV